MEKENGILRAERTLSGSSTSSYDELEQVEPLSLSEVVTRGCHDNNRDEDQKNRLPPTGRYFSRAMGLGQKRKRTESEGSRSGGRSLWKTALRKIRARSLSDPWEKFNLAELESERATRYRYNALLKEWVVDECKVKMEKHAFNRGAMRECFRMKKLSSFSTAEQWNRESNNYVAKSYMQTVARETYFEDVKLQMDAKLWGEEYNRHNPPKKVDIIQMSVLEMSEREGKPLYHLEHYIDGDYKKYNSNSGFVDIGRRRTPQAFSHFTFERSGHQMIVVDIQGVGDLYTDPQIHTAKGSDYGDGNLGTRGMALFFHSHICNAICEGIGLTKFDLEESEKSEWGRLRKEASKVQKTATRGTEELCVSPSDYDASHLIDFFRKRANSMSEDGYDEGIDDSMDDDYHQSASRQNSNGTEGSVDSGVNVLHPRRRLLSQSSTTLIEEHERHEFGEQMALIARPSNVYAEVQARELRDGLDKKTGGSVLGQIHLQMAKYHEILRFCPAESEEYDKSAALFHLNHAADCGELDAIRTIAQIYLNLSHDILVEVEVPENEENITKGVRYMIQAAEAGCRTAMLYLAKAYDTGRGLGSERSQCWVKAMHWYDEAINQCEGEGDESGGYDSTMDDPPYSLYARQAEMCLEGGHNLTKDPTKSGELYTTAAESAMACMKGRLATRYYMLAEEAWSEIEE